MRRDGIACMSRRTTRRPMPMRGLLCSALVVVALLLSVACGSCSAASVSSAAVSAASAIPYGDTLKLKIITTSTSAPFLVQAAMQCQRHRRTSMQATRSAVRGVECTDPKKQSAPASTRLSVCLAMMLR